MRAAAVQLTSTNEIDRNLEAADRLTRAAAANDGPGGLTAGLELLRETCARFWDELHPVLDRESDDPSEQAFRRVTALNELADRTGLLRDLRDMPILEARGIGRFGLRAIHLAQVQRELSHRTFLVKELAVRSGKLSRNRVSTSGARIARRGS